ncbi:MAG: hypothetical protein P8K80_06175 [Phycisphaerales bacterium]|nr:hypothetical protein [Phycisphaerales bacterium]
MTLEEKVATLESRLRRQRLGMAGMGLGLAVALFLGMAQQSPKEMTLESLTLTKDGTPRIVMGTNPTDGGVGIGFLDLQGKARVAIGTDAGGDGGMFIMDKNESPNIAMGSGKGGAGIMLIGAGLTEIPAQQQPDKD